LSAAWSEYEGGGAEGGYIRPIQFFKKLRQKLRLTELRQTEFAPDDNCAR
jgi:hypothetical protein